jgi:Histidine kinase-, DNA gyrase B-, and HSP90-like ATPase
MELQIGPEVINSYKRLAYTPWHAFAEFVDNSTQSYFNHKAKLDQSFEKTASKLTVIIDYNKKKGVIRISDNAMGMSETELESALHVGRPPTNTSGRSKYGMGLKTAASWLGNVWSIKTKRLGDTVEHHVTVEVEAVADGNPTLAHNEKDNRPVDDHYTVIEIRKLNRVFPGRTLGKIKSFLRSMYREDFRNERLRLFWGAEQLIWEDAPDRFLLDRSRKPYQKNFKFSVGGKAVRGWVGILDRGSREDAGFSIIHCGRMVRGFPDSWRPELLYGQFQGSNDLVNQRLVGEIHLDAFDVSHTKDDILWLGDQEEKVEAGLLKCCADYRETAKTYRKGKDDSRKPSSIETAAAIDEFKQELKSPELADSINLEPVPPKKVVEESVKSIADSIVNSREDTFKGKVGNLTVRLFVVDDMSPNDPYVTLDARRQTELIVVVNQCHPHWAQLKGSEGVLNHLRHCTYDGIAEWQARSKASRIDPDTIKLLKDKLLRVPLEIEKHASD